MDDRADVERVFYKTCQSDNHPSNHFSMPKYQFKIMIIGKSGTGKSVLALNMLMKYLSYDSTTIFQSTVYYQNKYSIFKDLSGLFSTNILMKESVLKNIILVDDAQEAINSEVKKFNALYTKGRHHSIHPLWLGQNYLKAPIRARANTTVFIFVKLNSIKSTTRIWREVAIDLTKKVFFTVFLDSTQPESGEKYGYFIIDTEADCIALKYKKEFNRLFLIDEKYSFFFLNGFLKFGLFLRLFVS